MARLSAPAIETPKTDRKSSRFREIFKHRPSSSASSSPATLTKSPPHVGSSPLPSPSVRPGFQQIGLLPSERSSHSLLQLDANEGRDGSTGSTVAEVLGTEAKSDFAKLKAENQVKKKGSFAQSLKGALSRHPVENADRDVATSEIAMSEYVSPQVMGDADKRSSLPLGASHKIAEAFYHKNTSPVSDLSIDGYQSFFTSPHNSGFTKNSESAEDSIPEQYKSLVITDTIGFTEASRMLQQVPCSVESAKGHRNDTTLSEEDTHSCRRKSFASNIFDDHSSLSQGIQEYITKKIAEALAGYNQAHTSDADATVSPPLHLTIKIDATILSKAKASTRTSIGDGKIDLFKEPSTLGPLRITSSPLAKDFQLGIIAIYAVLLLSATLLGPKSLLLTVWRMAIILGMYTAVLRQLDWTKNVERDVILAPVVFTASVATGMGKQLLDQMRVVIVAILAEVLERVAQGAGVQVRTE